MKHLVVVGTCSENGFGGIGCFPVVMPCWALSSCMDEQTGRIWRIGLFSCSGSLLGT